MSAAPPTVPVDLDAIPAELRALDRWVVWQWELRGDKWTKPPFQTNGKPAKSTDPTTWTTFNNAAAALDRFDGIGLALTPDDNLVGVDLDHCVDESGIIADWARSIVDQLDSYTEVSPSGTGLRVLVRGELPPDGCRRGNVEMYQDGRYLTMTGATVDGRTTIEPRQPALEAVHAEHVARVDVSTATPPQSYTPALSDLEIIEQARNARNGSKFLALYNGDDRGHNNDRSAADLALVSVLAFWTQDAAQLDRLFRGSPRMRDKWDARHSSDGRTYGQLTIGEALANVSETYTPPDHVDLSGLVARVPDETPDPDDEIADDPPVDRVTSIRDRWIGLDHHIPDPVPLIPDVLDLDAAGLLYARWGCYKTFLGVDWAMHVALGLPWLGRPVERRPVVVLGYEAPNSIHRRAQGWCRYHGHDHPDTFLLDRRPPRLDRLDEIAVYREALDEIDAGLVIVDTVARGASGRDLNTYEADVIVDALHLLQGDRRTALGVAHAGKDASRGVKGSTALEDGADFVFRLDRKRNSKGHPTGPATLSNPKQKDRASFPDRLFDLSDGLTRLNISPNDRVLLPIGSADEAPAPTRTDRAVEIVRAFLAGHPGWQTAAHVKDRCRRSGTNPITREDVAEAVDRLVELEQVERDTDDNVRMAERGAE